MRLDPQQEQATVAAYLTMSARLSGIYGEFEVLLAQLSAPAASELAGESFLASMVRRWRFKYRMNTLRGGLQPLGCSGSIGPLPWHLSCAGGRRRSRPHGGHCGCQTLGAAGLHRHAEPGHPGAHPDRAWRAGSAPAFPRRRQARRPAWCRNRPFCHAPLRRLLLASKPVTEARPRRPVIVHMSMWCVTLRFGCLTGIDVSAAENTSSALQ